MRTSHSSSTPPIKACFRRLPLTILLYFGCTMPLWNARIAKRVTRMASIQCLLDFVNFIIPRMKTLFFIISHNFTNCKSNSPHILEIKRKPMERSITQTSAALLRPCRRNGSKLATSLASHVYKSRVSIKSCFLFVENYTYNWFVVFMRILLFSLTIPSCEEREELERRQNDGAALKRD